MIDIDMREIDRLKRGLERVAKKAIPYATRNTLNAAAFATQRTSREEVKDEMTLRNRFTLQSIRVEQTRTLNIRQQAAIVGSTADYMEDQEFGTVKTKKGSQGVTIATSYSAGQGESRPRTRLPRRANTMASIRLSHRRNRGTSRKQRNLIAIMSAAESGQKYVFLDLGRTKGIFKVVGGKRRPKIRMVHDMSRTSVVIPRNPWLAPSVKKTERIMPELFKRSLLFQAKRVGLVK